MTTGTTFHEQFTQAALILLEESFETVRGIYLDRGTSMFETLATITAAEASRPVGKTCATLAAQVAHVSFYIDTILDYVQGRQPEKVDWAHIWNTVSAVTPDEWAALIAQLRDRYQRIRTVITNAPSWEGENVMAGVMGLIAHNAYHLGEIRQALCTIKG